MRRLEPHTRSHGIEAGLAARVHDPLWLLARQWHLGEFRAEDAPSPAYVEVEAEVHALDHWRPTGTSGWRPYRVRDEPLEAVIEREPVAGPGPRLRLDGGLRWRRLLEGAGLGDLVPTFTAACPFVTAGPVPPPPPGSTAAAVRSRLPDGAALAGPLARLADPATTAQACDELGLPPAAGGELATAATAWLAWWTLRVPVGDDAGDAAPGGHPDSWDEHRLEHHVELGSSTLADTVLRAPAYEGGRLDWWSFDAVAEEGPPSSGSSGSSGGSVSIRAVPAPARFGGMPAPRFWEMEDARFDPGAIDAGPIDLGRLLLATFATVYGNDWFVLPVRLPAASLVRVASLVVHDVFGGETPLARAGADDDGWNLFGLTQAGAPRGATGERPTSDWFLLAPALAVAQESRPIETVLFLRDEVANLGWAVEATVTDDAGGVVDRAGTSRAGAPGVGAVAGTPGPDRYVVQTEVPEHWYPLVAEPLDDHESVRLRLVPVARSAVDGAVRAPLPVGALLATVRGPDGATLWLHEEEVPGAGLTVVRTHQRARWFDGSVHTWTGRRTVTGAGEASSGLRFDAVEPG